jgi:hypothetical protein
MKYNELIMDEVYFAERGVHKYIVRMGPESYQHCINLTSNSFFTNGNFSTWPGDHYTNASPAQIKQLEDFEKVNGCFQKEVKSSSNYLIFN